MVPPEGKATSPTSGVGQESWIQAIVGTDSCQVHHLGMMLEGKMRVVHEDGTESDLNAGDIYSIEPGHDAWVVGDEAAVGVEFDTTAAKTFGKEQ